MAATASASEHALAARGRPIPPDVVVGAADCSAAKLGTDIPASSIGEPVSSVTLQAPTWVAAAGANPAYCSVRGSMAPIDPAAPNINFAVALPSTWSHRAVQLGGGGNNGSIPGLTGGPGAGATYLARGWAASGSDSGHQGNAYQWALNDEAVRNFGFMQMKKTHDAARVLMQRMYGGTPVYSYWVGSSQGGREGITVAKRYPGDYDGVLATVPVLAFSSLTLSRVWHRQQEIPLANWVTPAKTRAIATEVVRRCDALDGLADGIINNYMACRSLFDVKQGGNPWQAKRCPDGVDPDPTLTTADACLTDGQISTMEFVQTRYAFATPLAYNTRTFGMWVPNTDPGGSGMIVAQRFRGQEGAAPNAPIYDWLGAPHVVGALFQDLSVNPLTYVEGGELNDRRIQLSEWIDSTHPDLTGFYKSGGKLISIVGTGDSLASSGAQLDYFQSVIDRMGRTAVDAFARLYVMPHANHGLGGTNYGVNGDGVSIPQRSIANSMDRLSLLIDWVENGVEPPKSALVTGGGRSLPLCSYPQYPRYLGDGLPVDVASSYACTD